MAINPETQYPGKINPSTGDYPYGSARNVTVPGDGTGTPWEAAIVNDLLGFQQTLLSESAIVPSGTPDRVGASQYFQALTRLLQRMLRGVTALQAVGTAILQEGAAVQLAYRATSGDEGGGVFVWRTGDFSTEVAADEVTAAEGDGGIWVAPASDKTGASGAWERIVIGGTSVKWYGALGDGTTDDSVPLQKAVDAASARFLATSIPQTLIFPRGTYVCRLVYLKPGVNYYGFNQVVILKTPAGGETDEDILKWWRMFTTTGADWNTAEAIAHRCIIDGLTFDGNLANMNWANNTYNQEQAHCLFLTGPSAGASAEARSKFKVRNVHFQNSVADGLSQYVNTDLIVESITADNCFRGGFTSTGGNSKTYLRGYIGENARFDIEVDGAGFGGSFSTDYDIEDVVIDRDGGGVRPGGIDFGGSRGGEFRMVNVKAYTEPMNAAGAQDDPQKTIRDCLFTLGGRDSTSNRFTFATNALYETCDFHVKYEAGATNFSAIHMFPSSVLNATMKFKKCRFILDDDVKANEPTATCIAAYFNASFSSGSDDNGNTKYIFEDCESIGQWDEDIGVTQGGTVDVIRGSWAADTFTRVVSTAGRPAQVTFRGEIELKDTVNALFGFPNQATQTNAFVKFEDVYFSRAVEAGGSLSTYPIAGCYRFPVTAAPSAFGAVRGAIAELDLAQLGESGNQIAVTSWVAVTSSGASAAFTARDFVTDKDTTANRPTLSSIDVGVNYLDTTLDPDGKPIWWNGTAWVDATGAVV